MVKSCSGCEEVKPFGDFFKRSRHGKYAESKAGYSNKCKPCTQLERKAYKALNLEKVAATDTNSRLKRTYGIDLAQYNELLAMQNDCCIGCEKHQSELTFKLAVDHDHATGAVRGLLCINCNAVLGQARDNIQVLKNLINYLSPEVAANTTVLTLKSVKKVG